jgi:ElaB/YqjD/DUF883 family membrane-anchored ribosome-binding protein
MTYQGLNMNNINSTADGILQGAVPMMTNAIEQADDALQSGMDSVRQRTAQLRNQADHANQVALGYIRQEPVKSILIAAATGAALMAVLSLLNRSHHAK